MKSQAPFYFRMFIGIAYIVLGLVALTTDAAANLINNKSLAIVFGLACVGYGTFRMYRAQKRWDVHNHEQ